jgi:hypothetical protein
MIADQRGVAMILTLFAMLLLSAIGAALVLATTADVQIASNAGAAIEAFCAADAAFERALGELSAPADFTSVLNGSATSAFMDGPSAGERTLADKSRVDLEEIVNLANCQKPSGCSDADLNASIAGRPWGPRNPRWRIFSHGPLDGIAGNAPRGAPLYTVSMVADDPSDSDGDPLRDGARTGATANPGAGILLVRAEAFGRRGAHRVVEGSIVRQDLAARARWEASDPLRRGPEPPTLPILQVLARREVR